MDCEKVPMSLPVDFRHCNLSSFYKNIVVLIALHLWGRHTSRFDSDLTGPCALLAASFADIVDLRCQDVDNELARLVIWQR